MTKYILGFTAGVSVVPFAYFSNALNGAGFKVYAMLLLVPTLIIAFTAIMAVKLDKKKA